MEQHVEAFLVLLGYNLRGFISRVQRFQEGVTVRRNSVQSASTIR